ncbi:MAG TPA: DUF3142 domain-containing protein [Terriglobia bacterium]|nr:DUF3142 domain-containing protein [Terriglobia bacterium]
MVGDIRDLRRLLLALCIVIISCIGAGVFIAGPRLPAGISHDLSLSQVRVSHFPQIILWAWERPADLHYIDPREVGVAFLASTVYLSGSDVAVRPRLQPLKVPPGTFLMATVRIETNHTRNKMGPPLLSQGQCARVATAIIDAAGMPSVCAVQIDFDATSSERAFYRDLLNEVRRQLPDSTSLSITALASWCAGDQWMEGLPIDEAVPMLFRMGPDRREILGELRAGQGFPAAICNQSVGISTDEPLEVAPRDRRRYIFHPDDWSEQSVREAIGGARQ